MDLDIIYAQNSQCPVRSIGDSLIIMAPSGDTTHSLEDIGAFIWNQLDGQRNLHQVLDVVLADYDTDAATAREDLTQFITQMDSAGIILKT